MCLLRSHSRPDRSLRARAGGDGRARRSDLVRHAGHARRPRRARLADGDGDDRLGPVSGRRRGGRRATAGPAAGPVVPGAVGARRLDRQARRLRDRGGAGPGRDGRGAQGARPGAGPLRRGEGAGPVAGGRPPGPRPVPPRGAGGGGDQRPPRRHDPQGQRHSRPAVPGHGVRQRLPPRADQGHRPAGDGRGPADRRAGREGPGGGAPGGRPAPRHQAGEHPAGRRGREGEDLRLRAGGGGAGRRGGGLGLARPGGGHARLHEPRAGPRRAPRRPQRPVQPGLRDLRHVRRPIPVPGRDPRGGPGRRLRIRARPAAGAPRLPDRRSAGGAGRATPRQGSRAAARLGGRGGCEPGGAARRRRIACRTCT